jgi:hypothetical protein
MHNVPSKIMALTRNGFLCMYAVQAVLLHGAQSLDTVLVFTLPNARYTHVHIDVFKFGIIPSANLNFPNMVCEKEHTRMHRIPIHR